MRNFSVVCSKWDLNPILNLYQIVVMLVIVIGNCLLVVYILESNYKRLKSNLLILALTLSDLGAGSIPSIFGLIVSYFDVSQQFCEMYLFFALLFARISSQMIMVISFDRFFRLKYSMEYQTRWRNTSRKLTAIFAVWASGITLSTIHILDSIFNAGNYTKGCFLREHYSHWERCELLISIVIPNIVAVILYFKVLIFVRDENLTKHIRRSFEPTHNAGSVLRRHCGHYIPVNLSGEDGIELITTDTKVYCFGNKKSSLILGLIIWLNFTLITIPAVLYVFYLNFPELANPFIFQSLNWIFWLSSAVNPFIFALLHVDFRTTIARKFYSWYLYICCHCKKESKEMFNPFT